MNSDLIMMSYIGTDDNETVEADDVDNTDIEFDPFAMIDGQTIDATVDATIDNGDKRTMMKALKNEKLKKIYIGGSIISSLVIGSMVVAPVIGPIMIVGPVAAYCIYKLNGL